MKKIFLLLATAVLVFVGYYFFTGDYLGDIYINNGGGIENSNDSTDNSTPTKLNFTIDGINFQRETSFDFFNPERCDSYENFKFLGCSTQYGSYPKSEFYVEMNGFPCYVVLPTDSITSLDDLLNIENLNWVNGPVGSSLTIFNISNPKYSLTDYFITFGYVSDVFLPQYDLITFGPSTLPEYDYVAERCQNLGIVSFASGYEGIGFSLCNPKLTIGNESLLYNLSSPLDYSIDDFYEDSDIGLCVRKLLVDPYRPENNESYENWTFIKTEEKNGGTYSQFYVKINGYHVVVTFPGTIPSTYEEFLELNFNDNSLIVAGPTSHQVVIYLPNNSIFSNCYYFRQDGSTVDFYSVASSMFEFETVDFGNDFVNTTINNSACTYSLSLLLPNQCTELFSDWAPLYSLYCPIGEYSSTETANYLIRKNTDDNESTTVGKWVVEDEYVPTSEEDDYSWGDLIWSNSDGLTNAGHNSEDGWGVLYG